MINLATEKDIWNAAIAQFDGVTLQKIVELGQHWVQIKTLEENEVSVYGAGARRDTIDAEMRWVVNFLFDLRKKIWQ